jgi:hypothetical protein
MGEATTKRCCACGETKPIGEFAWRRKALGQHDSHCRPCRSEYGKWHYRANRQKYIEAEARRKRARNEERMRRLIEYFQSHPCTDCGETDPMVLEFDHLGNKSFAISQGFSGRNWQTILNEMAKCEVVCANCHRRRTASRNGHVRGAVVRLRSS